MALWVVRGGWRAFVFRVRHETFREAPTSRVFVFGKRVDDFRVVDYDQLFSMNIGATQRLVAENQDLKARIAVLEKAVATLQKQK